MIQYEQQIGRSNHSFLVIYNELLDAFCNAIDGDKILPSHFNTLAKRYCNGLTRKPNCDNAGQSLSCKTKLFSKESKVEPSSSYWRYRNYIAILLRLAQLKKYKAAQISKFSKILDR